MVSKKLAFTSNLELMPLMEVLGVKQVLHLSLVMLTLTSDSVLNIELSVYLVLRCVYLEMAN